MYVIAGVTGQTGSAVANWLLEGGQKVTVLARSADKGQPWKERGAQIAITDLADSKGLQAAFAGASGAYLLVPPNYTAQNYFESQKRIAAALAEAVSASGISHVVLLSSFGAQHASGTGLILSNHNAEEALKRSAKGLTILRPSSFLENWAPLIPMARENGTLPSFLKADRKFPMIATTDIGRIAAECLLNPTTGHRVVELTGPEDYSPTDIAGTLSGLLNREVRVAEAPISAAVPTFQGFGFSEDVGRNFGEMYQAINAGLIVPEGAGTGLHRCGTTPEQVFSALIGQSAHA
jgi:uncharacterized protein YbjT (DUF2867 family)